MASIAQAKNIVRAGIKAGVSTWIWSNHGQGKSDLVRQVAKAEDMECIDIRAALTEAGDWMGLPYHAKAENGDSIMKFATSPFLPRDKTSKGLLFLDELNRARPDVINCVFQLALDRRIGNHYELPDGWHVIVASNPFDSDYQVTGAEPALLGRFCHVQLTPTHAEWVKYAKTAGMRDDVVSFIADNDKALGNVKSGVKLDHVKENPRAWEMFNKMVNALEEMGLLEECLTDVGTGIVGATYAVQFAEYRKTKFKRINAEKILLYYDEVRGDVKHMVKNGRLDALKDAIDNLLNPETFDHKAVLKDEKQLKNMAQFFTDVPADVSYTGIKTIVQTYPPEFTKALLNADGKKELFKRVVALSEG
jgi:hypothetical protein